MTDFKPSPFDMPGAPLMPNQNKSKVTIDADGTIHVDNGDRQQQPKSNDTSTNAKPSAHPSVKSEKPVQAAKKHQNIGTDRNSYSQSTRPAQRQPLKKSIGSCLAMALFIFFAGGIIGMCLWGFVLPFLPPGVVAIIGYIIGWIVWTCLPTKLRRRVETYIFAFAFVIGLIAIPFGLLTGVFPLAVGGVIAILITIVFVNPSK